MFGIGGGFLMTPLLIFVGIAPAGRRRLGRQPHRGVVVFRRAILLAAAAIDPLLALVLLSGGSLGTALGSGPSRCCARWASSIC